MNCHPEPQFVPFVPPHAAWMNCGTYAAPLWTRRAETSQPRIEKAKDFKPHIKLDKTTIERALEVTRTLPPFIIGKQAALETNVRRVEDGQRLLKGKIEHVERQCRDQVLKLRAEREREEQVRDSGFARLHMCIRDLQEQHELLAKAFQTQAPTVDSLSAEVAVLKKQVEEHGDCMSPAWGHIADGTPRNGASQFDLLMGEIKSLRNLYMNFVNVRPSKSENPVKTVPKKKKAKPKVGRRKRDVPPMTMVTRSAAKRATRSVAFARRSECI